MKISIIIFVVLSFLIFKEVEWYTYVPDNSYLADSVSTLSNSDREMLIFFNGFAIFIIVLFTIFCHIAPLLEKSYRYDMFVARRRTYIATLESARLAGRDMEAIKTLEATAEWNDELAQKQVQYRHVFFGCYVDKRFLDLEPIF